jgi:hypothetical protein
MSIHAGMALDPKTKLKTPKSPLAIRTASFDDYFQIADLQRRNGLAMRPYEDWAALWGDNPACKAKEWPIGWVLETDNGQIVGSIGNLPFAYHFRGRELCIAATCAWAVDPGHRRSSIVLLDRLMRQEDVDFVICTTVSANAEPVLKGFRWSKAPVGTWDRSAFWITGYRGFARSALRLKAVPFANAVSYPVAAALFCRNAFKGAKMPVGGASPEVDLRYDFDSRFDDFWEELKHENHNVLLALRTERTLSWHFRRSLKERSAWILTAFKGSRMVAYAVFDRQDNIQLGLQRVRLVDFQALRGSGEALGVFLGQVLNKCNKEGVHVLENIGCWLDRPGLPAIRAPHHRMLASSMYYYTTNDKDLSDTLKDPMAWTPTSYDGDASL